MSFFSSKKDMAEWLWYVRESDFSVHFSPDPVVGGTEVAAPPNPPASYTWDWGTNEWVVNRPLLKAIAMQAMDREFKRLEKFNALPALILATIQLELDTYRDALRMYIKDFDPLLDLPEIPMTLTEESFYNL